VKTVFVVDLNGDLHGVHSGLVETLDLGSFIISRASSVEFNNHTQMWEARDLNGKVMASHASRQKTLDMEKQIVQEKLVLEYA